MVPSTEEDVIAVVADIMKWLERPDNVDWLLVFDNVDQYYEQGGKISVYDIQQYLPADHGAVLITTRFSRLTQLSNSKQLKKVDKQLAKAIFKQWRGAELGKASYRE